MNTRVSPNQAQRSGGRGYRPHRWVRAVCFDPTLRHRAMVVVGVLALLSILVVAFFSYQGGVAPYDRALSEQLQGFDTAPFPTISEAVSAPGYSPWNGLMAAACCILVGLWLRWQVGLFLAVITLVQGLIGILLKFPIQVPRPMETDLRAPLDIIKASSFPSGHTTMYVVLLGFTVYLLWKHGAPALLRWGGLIVTSFLVLFIGPARIHMGAHWVGDVVGAYLIGFFVLFLAMHLYDRYLIPRLNLDCVEYDP